MKLFTSKLLLNHRSVFVFSVLSLLSFGFSCFSMENRKQEIIVLNNRFPHPFQEFINGEIRGVKEQYNVTVHAQEEVADKSKLIPETKELYEDLKKNNRLYFGGTYPDFSKADLVVAEWGNIGNDIVKELKKCQTPPPLIVRFRGSDGPQGERIGLSDDPKRYDGLKEYINTHGGRLMPNCKYFADLLEQNYSLPQGKMTIHPSAANTDKYIKLLNLFKEKSNTKKDNVITFVSVNRFTLKKAMFTIIAAVNQVAEKTNFPIRYNIIGDGQEEEKLKKQVNDLGLNGIVSFLGSMSHDDVLQQLLTNDFLLAASDSHSDGKYVGVDSHPPNNVKEGAIMGTLPIVAYEEPWFMEHEVNGFHTPQVKADDLAKIIIAACETKTNNPEKLDKMRIAASKKAIDMFDGKNLHKSFAILIGQLLDKK